MGPGLPGTNCLALWSVDDVDDVDGGRQAGHHGQDLGVPLFVLDEDPIAELVGTGQPRIVGKVGVKEEAAHEAVAKDVLENLGHFRLLLQ